MAQHHRSQEHAGEAACRLDFPEVVHAEGPDSQWSTATGYFPVRKSAAESDLVKSYFEKDLNYKRRLTSCRTARASQDCWLEPIRTIMQDAIVAVITGKQAPKEALDQAAQKANDVLSQ